MPTENRSSNTEMVSVPREHELKIRQTPLADLLSGLKTGEVRDCSDREFAVGDTVLLREIDDARDYTGTVLRRTITHVQKHFGLPDHLCVLSYGQPAPEPHPEPIAWMVGTAIWWTKEEAERDAAATGLPIVGLGPMFGIGPAKQHQGEPVAVLYSNGIVLTKADCGDVFDICCKVETPLYAHADPGEASKWRNEAHRFNLEVERLRKENEQLREVIKNSDSTIQRQSLRISNQRTQLAERDALLTKMKALFRVDDPFDLYDAVCSALSENPDRSTSVLQPDLTHRNLL